MEFAFKLVFWSKYYTLMTLSLSFRMSLLILHFMTGNLLVNYLSDFYPNIQT